MKIRKESNCNYRNKAHVNYLMNIDVYVSQTIERMACNHTNRMNEKLCFQRKNK